MLANVFDWLAGDKHLTAYISEYLFFFIDTEVNTFLRGKSEGKRSSFRGHRGQAVERLVAWAQYSHSQLTIRNVCSPTVRC